MTTGSNPDVENRPYLSQPEAPAANRADGETLHTTTAHVPWCDLPDEHRGDCSDAPEAGRVHPPYGGITACRNSTCGEPLGEEHGVYMHTNRETGKILMLCGPCSRQAQMYDALRLPLVPL